MKREGLPCVLGNFYVVVSDMGVLLSPVDSVV